MFQRGSLSRPSIILILLQTSLTNQPGTVYSRVLNGVIRQLLYLDFDHRYPHASFRKVVAGVAASLEESVQTTTK